MNREHIARTAEAVMRMLGEYTNGPKREMLVDPALYAYFSARFGKMRRQVPIMLGTSAKRIDYRHGGLNPVAIEFVVRPPTGGGQLYGSQNRSELRKLSRLPQTKAKLRALLLMDSHSTPLDHAALRATYEVVTLGPGNYIRMPVSVIYVQDGTSFQFVWKP